MKRSLRLGSLAAGLAAGALLGVPLAAADPAESSAPSVQPGTATEAPAPAAEKPKPAEPAAQPGTATTAPKPKPAEPSVQPGTATEAPAPAAEKPKPAEPAAQPGTATTAPKPKPAEPAAQPGTESPAPKPEAPATPAATTTPSDRPATKQPDSATGSPAPAQQGGSSPAPAQQGGSSPAPAQEAPGVPVAEVHSTASGLTGRISMSNESAVNHAEATLDRQWQLTRASASVGQSSVTVDVANRSVSVDTPAATASVQLSETEQAKLARAAFDAEVNRAAEDVARAMPEPVQQAKAVIDEVNGAVGKTHSQVKSDLFDAVAESAPVSESVEIGDTTVSASYDVEMASEPTAEV